MDEVEENIALERVFEVSSEDDDSKDSDTEEPKLKSTESEQNRLCRICYDDTLDEPVVTPCLCKGSVAFVHLSCLEKWLSDSNTTKCDLCQAEFKTERYRKYTVPKSIWVWLGYPMTELGVMVRDVRYDILTFLLCFAMINAIFYISVQVKVRYAKRNRQSMDITLSFLLIVIIEFLLILILIHCMSVLFKYHCKVWYFWWRRQVIIKVIGLKMEHGPPQGLGESVIFQEVSEIQERLNEPNDDDVIEEIQEHSV